jgi:hypothetical protein
VDRESLVLHVQLDEAVEEGAISLDLAGALAPLGDSLARGKELLFEVEYPSRFTGEFQAFVKDGRNKSEYGSMEFIESHDPRRTVTVALAPSLRVPPMGYRDDGFDPASGIRQLGLKISAQSDRVRRRGYRPFRGAIRIAKARIVDRKADPEPQIAPLSADALRPLTEATPQQFLAGSGVDRPWPLGYAFAGPIAPAHVQELEATYAAIARQGCAFTRVYLGDYRSGLVFDGQGRIAGVEQAFVEYIDRLAEIANRHGITVMFSLTDNTVVDGRGLERVEFIQDGDASRRFIGKVLSQFIEKLADRRVIWDIFNEPENATAVSLAEIQRYVDRVLVAGRSADPDARFTVVSRSRSEIVYWQGRGLDIYSHNIFTEALLDDAISAPRMLDAPVMVAEMSPELATPAGIQALRQAGYAGVGIWGWGTQDKYEWQSDALERVVKPLLPSPL